MQRRLGAQSALLLILMALIAGQTGPCGVGGGGGTGGNLVGTWRAAYNDPLVGPTTVDLVLQPNGQFSESYTSASSLTYITGPYFINFAGTPGLLRLRIEQQYPTEFCGPLGCTPIIPLAGESWNYSFNGNNQVTFTNFYCTDLTVPGCTLNYARVN
jgi:hypothetical protein